MVEVTVMIVLMVDVRVIIVLMVKNKQTNSSNSSSSCNYRSNNCSKSRRDIAEISKARNVNVSRINR